MDPRARSLLEKLLHNGEQFSAGVRSRAASLTGSNLAAYRTERSLQAKESFETTMRAARANGAVKITWDGSHGGDEGFISRIDLIDKAALASFLGRIPLERHLTEAERGFKPFKDRFPVLDEVLQRWAQLKKVRTLGPDSVQDWLDAGL